MIDVVKWYARGGGIAKCGPFDSQLEAVSAMRRADNGLPIEGCFVWPEIVRKEKR